MRDAETKKVQLDDLHGKDTKRAIVNQMNTELFQDNIGESAERRSGAYGPSPALCDTMLI